MAENHASESCLQQPPVDFGENSLQHESNAPDLRGQKRPHEDEATAPSPLSRPGWSPAENVMPESLPENEVPDGESHNGETHDGEPCDETQNGETHDREPCDETQNGETHDREPCDETQDREPCDDDGETYDGEPCDESYDEEMSEMASSEESEEGTPVDINALPRDAIGYWVEKHMWPKKYFEVDMLVQLLTRPPTPASDVQKRHASELPVHSIIPNYHRSRENKSFYYRGIDCEVSLATHNSYMFEEGHSPDETTDELCGELLEKAQKIPQDSLFSDPVFPATCKRAAHSNVAKVIQNLSRLIVPSAEELADRGDKALACLLEADNEAWNNCLSLLQPRPQPDFTVGFREEAFTEGQRNRLFPFIDNRKNGSKTYFMATHALYFPFLTCEVVPSGTSLDIADRQNAHSMTVAVRAIVQLFRLVTREDEVNGRIVAFSISHNGQIVRIYGHYAIIGEISTTYHRHLIRVVDIAASDGEERWTSYRFVRNVYELWMPEHFARLCSAIDDIPLRFWEREYTLTDSQPSAVSQFSTIPPGSVVS